MIKSKLIIILVISLTVISCSSRKNCSKKNKTRVEMGWMLTLVNLHCSRFFTSISKQNTYLCCIIFSIFSYKDD